MSHCRTAVVVEVQVEILIGVVHRPAEPEAAQILTEAVRIVVMIDVTIDVMIDVTNAVMIDATTAAMTSEVMVEAKGKAETTKGTAMTSVLEAKDI